ncbi:hypothetical protein B0J12DRAFT_329697 [Macrophomina phaseolina]|uniref:Uncharacterized protein n=1 Tax=Macrophomina phaseolina TaxID=35725 RepID=A0ABQ8FXN5_9PEZI|nr:hypothetical protein B0J12DRAFT_329697 [Macrophomina phaseolina]
MVRHKRRRQERAMLRAPGTLLGGWGFRKGCCHQRLLFSGSAPVAPSFAWQRGASCFIGVRRRASVLVSVGGLAVGDDVRSGPCFVHLVLFWEAGGSVRVAVTSGFCSLALRLRPLPLRGSVKVLAESSRGCLGNQLAGSLGGWASPRIVVEGYQIFPCPWQ